MELNAFSEAKIGNLVLKNRIIRSATYEGASDLLGYPLPTYKSIYETLAKNDAGMIISGFSFVSNRGRAMQIHQSGIEASSKIPFFREITNTVHKYNCPLILQISHTGRQTLKQITHSDLYSSTETPSVYFREKVKLIDKEKINIIKEQFADSAFYAKESGFDGIQIHAAHGYLIHQFLLPETNKLKNEYGIDKETGLGTKLLEEIYEKIRTKCGQTFPVLIKISGDHDLSDNFYPARFIKLIKILDNMGFDAIEISYGTMDYALNIFRGDFNYDLLFKYNPLFKTKSKARKLMYNFIINSKIKPKFKDFSFSYNLKYAETAKRFTDIPVISVGGFRSKRVIEYAIRNKLTDFVSLSRPFIAEPDFIKKMQYAEDDYISKCTNCNDCVLMCDSGKITQCYRNKHIKHTFEEYQQ